MGRDPHISALIEPSMIRYASWSGTPAGSLDHELDAQKYDPLTGQSETGTFVTTAMRQFGSGADIAFCPTGSFNKSAFYQKGTITNGELGLMIDHNNRLSWITMSGADIKNVLETSASFMKPFPDNRTGIVTPVHPLVLQVSGITMNIDPAMDPGQRVSNVKLVTESGSTDLRPDQKYRVVVNTRIGQFDKRYGIFMEEPAGNVRNTDVRILDTVMDYTAYRNPVSDPARMPAATA
jgi:2',3'-cyclic-nucleotide 2'-phosphodiesterase (5'-nucleotidase family)